MNSALRPGREVLKQAKYLAAKTGARGLSSGYILCAVGIALLLLNLPYSYFLDQRFEASLHARGMTLADADLWFTNMGIACCLCQFLAPPLLLIGWLLRCGSRKTWSAVRGMEQVIVADLPHSDSLMRASQEPAQAQDGVLLRAASGETQTGQERQLLRATAFTPTLSGGEL